MLLSNVVSPLCACLCDDLTLEIQDGTIRCLEPVCPTAAAGYARLSQAAAPAAWRAGRECDLAEAQVAAMQILRQARAPLICGGAGMGTRSHRAAIQLAETLSGTIVASESAFSQALTTAMRHVGLSTCTLGEIRQHADLLVLWDVDPEVTHPRLLSRLSPAPSGRERRMLRVRTGDVREITRTGDDWTIPKGAALDLLTALRRLLAQKLPLSQLAGRQALFNNPAVAELLQLLVACRYGVLLFGPELADRPILPGAIQQLLSLVRDLNACTRWTARGLTTPGAGNVLTWQTGFTSAVQFQQRICRAPPGEGNSSDLLCRQAVDCAVILGGETLSKLTDAALAQLRNLPGILLLPAGEPVPEWCPSVIIPVAVDGVHTSDSIYRLDDVALPVRKILDSPLPTVAGLLSGWTETLSPRED
jgi:formylmethanofuran dehydrogenase subunit B